jgi:predicted MPP superfamily phosphohydrolase
VATSPSLEVYPAAHHLASRGTARISRRAFAAGSMLGALAAMAVTGIEAYEARYVHPYTPVLERIRLLLPSELSGLAGMRIGFVTDTHVGPFVTPDDLARAAALISAERPDLVLLGGDYVSESPRYIHATADLLGDLAAAAPLGAVAVLGNHDLAVSVRKVHDALKAVGIRVLRNEAVPVTYQGATLWIAGIDETLLGHPDPKKTFAAIPAGTRPLALWHEPQFAEEAAALGAFAQLSGHTHGGQIRLPGLGPVGLPRHGRRHIIGLNDAAGMPIYTARGVGVYRPPLRFNCPPEVTLIELVAKPAGSTELGQMS